MTYLSDKARSKSKYINIPLTCIVCALFIYYWSSFRAMAYPFVEPVLRGYGSSKIAAKVVPSFVSTYMTSHKTLADNNRNLELTIERLENELAAKDALIRERTFLDNEKNINTSPILVMYPVAEDVTKLYSTILLSKGYKEGIEKNGLVYVRGMQPVCEIIEVHDRTSLCELLSKGNRITEGVTSSSSIMLTLVGVGGGSFLASIPKEMNVSIGETVYLRSNPAYVLGTVVSIKENDQATGVKIYVQGAYNPVTSSVFYMKTIYAP